jgi:hypothetical protein
MVLTETEYYTTFIVSDNEAGFQYRPALKYYVNQLLKHSITMVGVSPT